MLTCCGLRPRRLLALALLSPLLALVPGHSVLAGTLTDVRGLVYSSTAAEVFWTRTDPFDRVEVTLNGNVVGLYDASSYFFGNLAVRAGQSIALRTIDGDGRYSEPVRLSFGTANFTPPTRQFLPDLPAVAASPTPTPTPAPAPEPAPQPPSQPDTQVAEQPADDAPSNTSTVAAPANACTANTLASLANCVQSARNNRLTRDQRGVGHIAFTSNITCGNNCCPSGNALLNLSDTRDITVHGNGFRLLRRAGQRSCSLLTAHNANNINLNSLVLDDDASVNACVVNDRCPRMLFMSDAANVSLSNVTVRYSKGYAIYVRNTNGFSFDDSTLEHSGVLGLYIGHEDDSSRNISVRRSRFSDNSTNALALLGVTGSSVIEDNLFERNHATGQWPVAPRFGTGLTGGGQVYLARASNVRFANNRVVDGSCSNCYRHSRLGTGVTALELGKPGQRTVSNIVINNNLFQNNHAYAVAANVTSPIDSSVRVTNNTLRGNGANWRLNGAFLQGNRILD